MAINDESEGMDLAGLVYDLSKEGGLICELIGSVFDYLLREKKVVYTDLVCAISYAREEWDV